MANIKQRSSGSWEIIIKRKSLPKPICASADTELEARAWADRMEAQLESGFIPKEFLTTALKTQKTIATWLDEYASQVAISPSDHPLIPVIKNDIGTLQLGQLSHQTLLEWINKMKERRLKPGSIRKRVGVLARAFDIAVHRELLKINVVRALPRGYANYVRTDGDIIEDTARERRLEEGEEARIREAIGDNPEWLLLFTLALETAMRLSEIYTLTGNQIDIPKRTIFLDKTKNGHKRQVPLSSVAIEALKDTPKKGNVFKSYCGDKRLTTMRLSRQFIVFTKKAGCDDLKFHDLRHEATCRLFERTSLSDLQISLITGHRDPRMLRRYSNLRGSDLALRLW